ncbi:MAG TPA: hypothetical protein VK013_02580 [Myxococcaceae bacterium]|nr:hypothetical protein [Myxococcaceae bacterium]
MAFFPAVAVFRGAFFAVTDVAAPTFFAGVRASCFGLAVTEGFALAAARLPVALAALATLPELLAAR